MEEFSLGELRAIEGALAERVSLFARAGKLAPRIRYRKQNTESALRKVRQEIEIRKVLTGKAGA